VIKENKIFLSVDVDPVWLARWATGSVNSLWPDCESCFSDLYGGTSPPDTLSEPIDKILRLFDELNFKSTFFFTGYIAELFPNLVKKIAAEGHEIGCHNYEHLDYEYESREKFRNDLEKSKKLLETLLGKEVIGYRSPNSSVPKSIVEDLLEFGIKYDSSVTPTRRIMGKFGDFTNAPQRPYHSKKENIGKEGDSDLVELPWAVFPLLKLPAGSGITHRIFGNVYNNLALNSSLKKGHTAYYFHPYEITQVEEMKKMHLPLKAKIFLQNCGDRYFQMLSIFLRKHQSRLVNGEGLYELVKATTS